MSKSILVVMFYDLEEPIEFAKQIERILSNDSIWHFEKSHMAPMLRLNSYDTSCHEHLKHYHLSVVENILKQANLKVIDLVMNTINAGSFAVTVTKQSNTSIPENSAFIQCLLEQEEKMGPYTPKPYQYFEEIFFRHKDDLSRLIKVLVADVKKVLGYGASTKGNVILQFFGLGPSKISTIADVNPEKFGHVTPYTHIPIISEA